MSPRPESVRIAEAELSRCRQLLHISPADKRWDRTSASRRSWLLYRAGLDTRRHSMPWAAFSELEQAALIACASVVAGRPVSFPRMSPDISDEAPELMAEGDYSAELVDGAAS